MVKRQLKNKILAYYVICCVAIIVVISCSQKPGILPYYNTADFSPEWMSDGDAKYNSIHKIAEFSFIDQNNQKVTNANFDGRVYIADFFFTTCPGICPQMTNNMAKLQDNYIDDDRIKFLSHSVTPWMDSVKQLKRYAIANGVVSKKWHLVTGDKAAIYNLARQSYFAEKQIGLQLDSEDFLHTENFLLVDSQRRIRGIYNGTIDSEMIRLKEDIDILLLEIE